MTEIKCRLSEDKKTLKLEIPLSKEGVSKSGKSDILAQVKYLPIDGLLDTYLGLMVTRRK